MTNFPLDKKSVEAVECLKAMWPELDHSDITAVLCLAAAHAMARFTDSLDLGKDLPCSGFALANDFVATALNAAHWASPNAGPRHLSETDEAEIEDAIKELEEEEGYE